MWLYGQKVIINKMWLKNYKSWLNRMWSTKMWLNVIKCNYRNKIWLHRLQLKCDYASKMWLYKQKLIEINVIQCQTFIWCLRMKSQWWQFYEHNCTAIPTQNMHHYSVHKMYI